MVIVGVPQGYNLGPILFNIHKMINVYIFDMLWMDYVKFETCQKFKNIVVFSKIVDIKFKTKIKLWTIKLCKCSICDV